MDGEPGPAAVLARVRAMRPVRGLLARAGSPPRGARAAVPRCVEGRRPARRSRSRTRRRTAGGGGPGRPRPRWSPRCATSTRACGVRGTGRSPPTT
ncbi:hypothetical protein NKH77_14110 [Streptomyces sp. M19]